MKKTVKMNKNERINNKGDYYGKLSPDERAWIEAFDSAYNYANPREFEELVGTLPQDFKKECYRRNYALNNSASQKIDINYDVYAEIRLKKNND